jgi:hypothetical protein
MKSSRAFNAPYESTRQLVLSGFETPAYAIDGWLSLTADPNYPESVFISPFAEKNVE